MDHRARLKTVEQYLGAKRFDAALFTHSANVRYLCGFTGSSGVLALAQDEWGFFTDGRYTEQAKAEVVGARVRAKAKAPVLQATEWLRTRFQRPRQARIALEADNITLATQARVRSEQENFRG